TSSRASTPRSKRPGPAESKHSAGQPPRLARRPVVNQPRTAMGKILKALADALTRALEVVMVICMIVMLVMVFGNVVLRLFFNTGIDLSEEMPRFAFVWMTFL